MSLLIGQLATVSVAGGFIIFTLYSLCSMAWGAARGNK